ncbi:MULTISPECIES: pyridoxal phosphate-dependent aminotransferase [Romboutsia]|uniref:pyridoxal phosphate-dependent aminotransferase n=1 Tax=Romboutsia TaxID=1501226 RepID=UPI00216C2A4B|nr:MULTISPECIES: histidinol-phosphate transaminase [Romboutsia]MCI9061613.1 aminotransferase class I/II-fold pyridoxal phosphate-dependent enzyme [Romboutsia sp.]MCI9259445.1 aminotransferase class I/II-fold pyridoxal phosphate-dependent enzyme [Romboutsia sp.]
MKINHGANLYDLSSQYGFSKEDIMDFSSNINPFGSSKLAKEYIVNNIDKVSVYPDPEYLELKTSISNYCNCSIDNILLGSGATELISSFIKTINPKKALILSPAYSEYEKELSKIECNITKYFSKKEYNFTINIDNLIEIINKDNYELIIICNPNNPTGFTFSKNEIEKILNNTNSFVMVDETYIEFTNTSIYSSTSLVDKYDNLFVIRGTSKFFSTPGIRLGYGLISNHKIKYEMNSNLDLWNINIFASMMGEVMFNDNKFIENTYSLMIKERDYLVNELSKFTDLKIYNSQGNFILCEIKSKSITAKEVREKLIPKRIIIRDCVSFDGLDEYFFRVCILKPEENKLLIDNLINIFK